MLCLSLLPVELMYSWNSQSMGLLDLYVISITKEKEQVGVSKSDFAAWDEEDCQEIFEGAKKSS